MNAVLQLSPLSGPKNVLGVYAFNVLPFTSGKAMHVDAVALARVVTHLERWLTVGMDGAAADAVMRLPSATKGFGYGPRVHLRYCAPVKAVQ